MTDNLRHPTNFKYGYTPSLKRKLCRKLAKFFVRFFRLNSDSLLSTEICQEIDPYISADFDGIKVWFKSGHGRLRWRAKTFSTEEPMMIDWLKTFNSDDVFLDIGANVGTYTIPGALKAHKTIAVELDPVNLYCLFCNIVKNSLTDKIIVVPIAMNIKSQIESIYYRDFSVGDALQSVGRRQVLPTISPQPFSTSQLTFSLDDLFEKYNLPSPTKIKIDVDGNEEAVFGGGWKIISSATEIYLEDNGLESDIHIIEKLRRIGFEVIQKLPSLAGSVKSDIAYNLILRKN